MKAAMTEKQSSWDPKMLEARGIPSKTLINLYKRWGEGEFGLILSGNLMIEYDHLEAAGNLIVPRDAPYAGRRFEAYEQLAAGAKKHGSLMVAQLSHPGRQVQDTIQANPISASDIQLKGKVMGMTFAQPRPATEADIQNVIEGFAHAAEYLEKAGWDGVELHAAHGYLLAQFLSPTTNHRTDKYGGPLENRSRLILDIAGEIRRRTNPGFIIGIKLNSVEFQDKGFNTDEARQLCQMLEANKFDFVELSGGTYEKLAFEHQRESTKQREAFFLEFAELITPALTQTKTYITGGLRTAGAMAQALDIVDGVGLARPACQEPFLPRDILSGAVKGAIVQRIDQNDFGLTNTAAGTQMLQIGNDYAPIDLSQPDNERAFTTDMAAWVTEMAEDIERVRYGYVDIKSAASIPF